jgi:hypothetical protein
VGSRTPTPGAYNDTEQGTIGGWVEQQLEELQLFGGKLRIAVVGPCAKRRPVRIWRRLRVTAFATSQQAEDALQGCLGMVLARRRTLGAVLEIIQTLCNEAVCPREDGADCPPLMRAVAGRLCQARGEALIRSRARCKTPSCG